MTDVKTLADDFVALLRAGRLEEAGETYWAPDVRSVEAMDMAGMGAVADGISAVRAKSAWWYGENEVHELLVDGPHVNGDQFALHLTIDATMRATGVRSRGAEIALYTVRAGKIVEERFFY